MNLSMNLLAALNTYFAFQTMPHQHGTVQVVGWRDDPTRQRVCAALTATAEEDGWRIAIRSDGIALFRDDESHLITGPIEIPRHAPGRIPTRLAEYLWTYTCLCLGDPRMTGPIALFALSVDADAHREQLASTYHQREVVLLGFDDWCDRFEGGSV